MNLRLLVLLLSCGINSFSQKDSTIILQETVVRGFENKRPLLQNAASISTISIREISKYSNSNFMRSLNAQAGVRLEERSPGSYRLAIRGSSLRSPFGVRNVKVYLNNIPISDANGQTYFNQLDINSIGSIEVLKGPSGSIFGASIGGVLSLKTKTAEANSTIGSELTVGSFGLLSSNLNYSFGSKKNNTFLNFSNTKTDGYRDHSAMKRSSATLSSSFFINSNNTLNVFALLSTTNYQTPGGLTLTQQNENRTASRPKAGPNFSAIEQKAAILQDIIFIGLSDEILLKNNFSINTALTFSASDLENPFITNYEKRNERSFGGRFWLGKKLDKLNLIAGTEVYSTNSKFNVFDNNFGQVGKFRNNDIVVSNQSSVFVQVDYEPFKNTILSLGASLNNLNIDFKRRLIENAVFTTFIKDKPVVPFSPRLSLLKSFANKWSVYGTLSSGFSSPTVGEFVSTYQNATQFNLLQAEKALNRELGIKYNSKIIRFELAYYNMKIQNGLVRNLTSSGNEYFTNVGEIGQKGIEFSSKYYIVENQNEKFISDFNFSLNYTFNNYKYLSFSNNNIIYNNNKLPGVPTHNGIFNFDVKLQKGFFIVGDLNYFSKIPLSDDNSIYTKSTLLSFMRIGFEKKINRILLKVYGGVDNLLNQKYSLGYDFNAFGARYYNPSPLRNYNSGLSLVYKF